MSRANNDILLIDDDSRHAKAFEEALLATGDASSKFEWVRTLSSGLEKLKQKQDQGNFPKSLFAR